MFGSLVSSSVMARPCPGSLYINSQTQIDSFQIIYPNCTEIKGDVWIHGDDITNLSGLNVLTSIGGNIQIFSNNALTSLSGLDNIKTT